MKIDLFAEGGAFTSEGLSLDETLLALTCFSSAYKNCLDIATDQTLKKTGPRPTLKISYVKTGSLDSQFLVDLSGALASLTPLIPEYAYKMICTSSWDIFIKTLKAAIALAKHFYENKAPITYNVTVFPGSVANFGQSGGTMNVSSSIDESLKKNYKSIMSLAELINNNSITHFKSSTDIKQLNDIDIDHEFNFTKVESTYFSLKEIETIDPDPLSLTCNIFSINRKSNNGRLDYFDPVAGPKPIPFTIKHGDINDYIEAMKHDAATVTATRSFMVNALGERKISHLFLDGIALP
jgi:hypothetical protein